LFAIGSLHIFSGACAGAGLWAENCDP